ncbi:MAG TPA: hypothetical protein VEW47_02375 [Candidatus Dormibacteraeota bacterium]|nr:hypothetical protein [Candidatus Dormibacteraeota bacterium]
MISGAAYFIWKDTPWVIDIAYVGFCIGLLLLVRPIVLWVKKLWRRSRFQFASPIQRRTNRVVEGAIVSELDLLKKERNELNEYAAYADKRCADHAEAIEWHASMQQWNAKDVAAEPFRLLARQIEVEVEDVGKLVHRLNAKPAPTIERRRSIADIMRTQELRESPPLTEPQIVKSFSDDRLPNIIVLRDKAKELQFETMALDACLSQPTTMEIIARTVAALKAVREKCLTRESEIRQ